MPEFIEGVINFRGEIVPVIDARKKFNMPERANSEKYVIIVLDLHTETKNLLVGVVTDGVKDVLEISDDTIKDVQEMGYNLNADFLKGMVHKDDKFIMILDVNKIFSTDEIVNLEKSQQLENA